MTCSAPPRSCPRHDSPIGHGNPRTAQANTCPPRSIARSAVLPGAPPFVSFLYADVSKPPLRMRFSLGRAEGEDHVEGGNRREEERIEAIEHAAVTGKDPTRVLDAHVALDRRLEQVTRRAGQRENHAERQRLSDGEEGVPVLVERDERNEERCDHPRQEALPRLARRQPWREL